MTDEKVKAKHNKADRILQLVDRIYDELEQFEEDVKEWKEEEPSQQKRMEHLLNQNQVLSTMKLFIQFMEYRQKNND